MGMNGRRQVLKILIEEAGCIVQDLVMSSVTTYCFTLLWPHWPFSSSDKPRSFLTWGLYTGYSCCLECLSLSPNPRLFEWLALHYSGLAHLSLLWGSFLTTLIVSALSPPSSQPTISLCFLFFRTLAPLCLFM